MFKKRRHKPGADLRGVDLSGADLRGADLKQASINWADLTGANLSGANLSYADLHKVNLSGAILRDASLRYADLRGADLREADLTGADLTDADLAGAILTDTKGLPPMVCPEKGSYIGYKKAKRFEIPFTSVIITLEIPEAAKRSSATSNKCRCSEAKVVSIESLYSSEKYDKATSSFDHEFIYKVGETVKVDDFNDDRWAECASGIHHFMTRKEAEEYRY